MLILARNVNDNLTLHSQLELHWTRQLAFVHRFKALHTALFNLTSHHEHMLSLPVSSLHQSSLGAKDAALATCTGSQYWQCVCADLHVEDALFQRKVQPFQADEVVRAPDIAPWLASLPSWSSCSSSGVGQGACMSFGWRCGQCKACSLDTLPHLTPECLPCAECRSSLVY